jgi:hypothetical protein
MRLNCRRMVAVRFIIWDYEFEGRNWRLKEPYRMIEQHGIYVRNGENRGR